MKHGKMLFYPDGGSQSGSPPAGSGDPPPKKDGEAPPAAGEQGKEGDGKPADKKTLLEGDGSGAPADKGKEGDKGKSSDSPTVPEKYDLKLPKDSTLDKDFIDRTAALARKLKMSNESAQAMLDSFHTEHQQLLEAGLTAHQRGGAEWQKRVDGWENDFKNDREVGGAKAQESITTARRVLKTFFPESVSQFLGDSGYGSNPDVIRALVKIGKALGEDQLQAGDVPSKSAADKPVRTEDKLYPKTAVKKE